MATLQLLMCSFVICMSVSAQVDSTNLFEKSKGLWQRPINSGVQILNSSGGFVHDRATFNGPKDSPVFAVFDGQVVSIEKKGSVYVIVTKFGKYIITYIAASNPIVKKDDFIKSGQRIGLLKENEEGIFEIQIFLEKEAIRIDPNLWFSN